MTRHDANQKLVTTSIFHIRPFSETDSLDELTSLLHLAYKKLADQGFRFLATHQDAQTTKERIKEGECFVAISEGKIIATITYYSPSNTNGNDWYELPFVSTFGQFAVNPEVQNHGIGGKLVDLVENLARRDRATEIAIDTAEGAAELIGYYKKRGYRFVGYTQWDMTNYRSVLLSKELTYSEHE